MSAQDNMTEKKQTARNTFSLIASVVQTVVILAFVGVALMSFSSRVPLLANNGFTFYNIVSGSMEPAIPTGSIIYAGKFKPEDLKKGDIITFQVKQDEDSKPIVVTHRITDVRKEEKVQKLPDGKEKVTQQFEFTTKGDANNKEDTQPVPMGNILGQYKWHIPYLGYVAAFAQTPQGFGLLVILPAAILIVWEVISLVNHFKKKYENTSKAEIEELKRKLAEKDESKKTGESET